MEQFKFALGPYELFASIVGGLPLTLAICLAYNPTTSLQDIISIIQGNFSTQIAIVFIFFSYILGGLVQGITWKYFLILGSSGFEGISRTNGNRKPVWAMITA